MTDRASFDRPAMVTAVILGLVLLGGSLPFTIRYWPEEGAPWVLAWSEEPLATATAPLSGPSGEATARATVADARVAALVVTFPSCNDSAVSGAQDPATIAWTLTDGAGTALAADELTCAEAAGYEFRVERTPIPDEGDATAGSRAEAAEEGWAAVADGNETTTFTLEVSWEHASTLPLPLPGVDATVDGEAALTPMAWRLEVREPAPEGVR